jgi:hypothetical protein
MINSYWCDWLNGWLGNSASENLHGKEATLVTPLVIVDAKANGCPFFGLYRVCYKQWRSGICCYPGKGVQAQIGGIVSGNQNKVHLFAR